MKKAFSEKNVDAKLQLRRKKLLFYNWLPPWHRELKKIKKNVENLLTFDNHIYFINSRNR